MGGGEEKKSVARESLPVTGWLDPQGSRGGPVGTALNSRFNDPWFEPNQEHKKKDATFSESKMLC